VVVVTAFGEPLSTRCEMPGQALLSGSFGSCAIAGCETCGDR
jgi:hypothetical protein